MNGKMGASIKDSSEKVLFVEKGSIGIRMGAIIRASLSMRKGRAKEYIIMWMVIDMKVIS